jgi:hypothetical protein
MAVYAFRSDGAGNLVSQVHALTSEENSRLEAPGSPGAFCF